MEYTLENVMCPEYGHGVKDHWEGCIKQGCMCPKTFTDILLHHLNAVARERDALRKGIGEIDCDCSAVYGVGRHKVNCTREKVARLLEVPHA